jgi:cysteine sulfinate desulfinase/cysteine desulfurase-like protein
MGAEPALAAALVRFSLGRENSSSEIERVCLLLPEVIRRSRLA